jgi:hypothetical protein
MNYSGYRMKIQELFSKYVIREPLSNFKYFRIFFVVDSSFVLLETPKFISKGLTVRH